MSNGATLIVTATPNPTEMKAVQAYLKGVMPLLVGAGGKLVKRAKVEQVIHGTPSGMVLVMDFDKSDTITEMFASDAYRNLVETRDRGFSEMSILVTQDMAP